LVDWTGELEREKRRSVYSGWGRDKLDPKLREYFEQMKKDPNWKYKRKLTRKLKDRNCGWCGEVLTGTHSVKWCDDCRPMVLRLQGCIRQARFRGLPEVSFEDFLSFVGKTENT
jgi:hypothetical protein